MVVVSTSLRCTDGASLGTACLIALIMSSGLIVHSSTTQYALPENLSGEALPQANQDAIAAILFANAARQPMVLVLEDWHWADEASDKALRYLLQMASAHPLMVVVN